MSVLDPFLFAELEQFTARLGHDGGAVGPSVYDTAQVLRFLPERAHRHQVAHWLMGVQNADGGWGGASSAFARDASTLAAVLALHGMRGMFGATESVEAGLAFLRAGAEKWVAPAPADIPIAAELVLPRLLADAAQAGLSLDERPYASLKAMGAKKCALLARAAPTAGSAPTHSWEAWGEEPDPALLDASGGVGHSPSATAAWLRAAQGRPGLDAAREKAETYLRRASAATYSDVPGLMPTVWPINRFEKVFFPYTLTVTGVLAQPRVRRVLEPLLLDTQAAFTSAGLGHSDSFTCDGDDTAAGVAVMIGAGKPYDVAALQQYERDEHFFTFPHEMSPSFSTTARGTHAYALAKLDVGAKRAELRRQQEPDGRWLSDKWHASWLYATCHGVAAMGEGEARWSAIDAVVAAQGEDGGFSTVGPSNAVETAYAALSLCADRGHAQRNPAVRVAATRALHWMMLNYRSVTEPLSTAGVRLWLGKETYCPARVDHSFAFAAFLSLSAWCQDGLIATPAGRRLTAGS